MPIYILVADSTMGGFQVEKFAHKEVVFPNHKLAASRKHDKNGAQFLATCEHLLRELELDRFLRVHSYMTGVQAVRRMVRTEGVPGGRRVGFKNWVSNDQFRVGAV